MSGILNPYVIPSVIQSAVLLNANAYDAEVMADAPQLFWKMNESAGPTATDASGNARNGTYGAAVTVGNAGLFTPYASTDKCPSFAADNDNSVVTSSYADNHTTALTLECLLTWEPTGQSTLSPTYLINKFRLVASNPSDYAAALNFYTQLAAAGMQISTDTDADIEDSFATTPPMESNGKFHVVGVYRNSGQDELYINGVLRASIPSSGTVASNAHNWAFGRPSVTNGGGVNNSTFKGKAGRIAIYNTALSAARILAHYNAAIQQIPSAVMVNAAAYDAAVLGDTPELFWKMNEASGTTATDSSGNGRHGTYGSAVTVGGAGLFGGADKCPSFVANDDDSVVTSSFATNFTAECTIEMIITMEPGQGTGRSTLLDKCQADPSVNTDTGISTARSVANGHRATMLLSPASSPTFDGLVLMLGQCEEGGTFHVAFVYRASGLCETYINGVQRATTTIGFTIASNAHNWAFGRHSVTAAPYINDSNFKGKAGRVALYSSALSGADILAHYNAGITP